MLLDLDDDRRAFRDAVRSWVDKNCPPERSLELEKREYDYPVELWDAMADAGFHAAGIPEEYGGQGGDAVDTAVLARELARSLGGLSWVWAVLLLARSGAPEQEGARPRTTLLMVPTDSPGIEMRYIPKLGMRAIGSCEVFLDDVFVPDTQLLGEPHRGFRVLLASLNNERILAGALALGMLDGIIDEAVAYAGHRTAFGKVIGAQQIIQHYIADMALARKQSELMVFDAAWREASGLPPIDAGLMIK